MPLSTGWEGIRMRHTYLLRIEEHVDVSLCHGIDILAAHSFGVLVQAHS